MVGLAVTSAGGDAMSGRLGASITAGLIAGVVFGTMMTMMTAPTPEGGEMAVMAMIGQIVGSPTLLAGWIYHLFNSALIGAIFGLLLGDRVHDYGSAFGLGAAYGFVWWILGGLILMPVMLGMAPFAPLMMPPMRMVAMGSLFGHLIFGLILGGGYFWLRTAAHRGTPLRA
jgi:hypothetical protein